MEAVYDTFYSDTSTKHSWPFNLVADFFVACNYDFAPSNTIYYQKVYYVYSELFYFQKICFDYFTKF